jgi:hypothetical protein
MVINWLREQKEPLEVYPFHHQNLFFHIVTEYDLTFQEVRGILDYLVQLEAFQGMAEDSEDSQLHVFQLHKVEYEVDVQGYEVIVYRRTELN